MTGPGATTDKEARARWVAGLAETARAALPEPVWDYFRAGAGPGVSADEAAAAWQSIRLLPKVLRGVESIDTSTTVLGESYAAPFGIAPTAMQRAAHPDGELAVVRAAAHHQLPVCVPMLAGHRFADIGAAAGRWWVQVYVDQGRTATQRALSAAGASALALTVDTPVVGTKYAVREQEWPGVDTSWHGVNYGPGSRVWATDLTLRTIDWLRHETGLPVVLKGVMRPDDAVAAVDAGAGALWVSNHGGRQLDRTMTTAGALAAVVRAVPGTEVFVDGGVRSGLDVLCAVALGARAAFMGRWPLYALASAGESGVLELLGETHGELVETMRIAGCRTPVEASDLIVPGGSSGL